MATIRDVAKESGVSVATVSRVMNGSGYAHEDTKKAVMAAVEKLNYKPNEVARSLYKRKSKLVGLILPDITNPFFPEMARGVEDYLQKFGYRLIFGNSDEKRDKEIEYIDTFLQNNVVGMIASTSEEANENFDNLDIPVVLLDRTGEKLPAVYSDQKTGGKLAARVLLDRGSTNIVLIRGPVEIKPVYERYMAALEELKQAKVNVQVMDSSLTLQGGQTCVGQLFEQYPETDGIIACNDIVAAAALQEILKRGIRIPEDIQLIGYDDIAFTALLHPPLSTIRQPAYEMGAQAAEMLIKKINQEKMEVTHKKLPVSFVERQTTRRKAEKA
ncbi:LacI family DNA-binding transcriptional regulator [Peribacillus simplex]|uniref:Catabolite control protein A n=1 Tax=Peribacillus simplex TaxID=1478 RepID=A0A9W4KKD4_9BACI|nr:LacI family DNA-binding transcriptional regulator [Peribacillus simplex]MDR4928867.1 LacI family DNA-binding transcriptional regulator [Peribacillus simplex]WHX91339.1 LacI family DNA-binding transcriptional regulator [Peribacillus simplex]CAH0125303.1 Catabolite control protein A [Peribacillus simplex]